MTAEEYGREYENGGFKKVAGYLYRWGRTTYEEAEEISQDSWTKGFKELDQFDGQSKVITWVTTIARNELLDILRKRNGYSEIGESVLENISDSRYENILNEIATRELATKLLSICPLRKKEILVLRYMQDLKLREIALVAGIPEGTVKTILSRGAVSLRERALARGLIH